MHIFGENQHRVLPISHQTGARPLSGHASLREYRPWSELRATLVADAVLRAFERLPDVYIFIKDRDRRFVYFDSGFEDMMGRPASELLGKRDEDISPEYLVDHYRSDDSAVLTAGIELTDIPELVRNRRGTYDWNITSKWPLYDTSGEIVGVAGVTRRLSERADEERYLMLTPAVDLMVEEISRIVPLADLATAVSLSPSQFSRTFKNRFGVTPQQYQRRIRVDAACELLSTTDLSIATIATRCGYYDQSHMTNEFGVYKKMPPRVYRDRFQVAE